MHLRALLLLLHDVLHERLQRAHFRRVGRCRSFHHRANFGAAHGGLCSCHRCCRRLFALHAGQEQQRLSSFPSVAKPICVLESSQTALLLNTCNVCQYLQKDPYAERSVLGKIRPRQRDQAEGQ